MTTKRFAYKQDDGTLAVVVPSPRWVKQWTDKGYSEDEIPWTSMNGHPGAKPHKECTVDDIPTDRTFRNGWELDESAGPAVVKHNMAKCKAIAQDRLRVARKPKLEQLDVEYNKADEAGDFTLKGQIAAKRQQLRDVTADSRLNAANPDALKSAMETIESEIEAV